MSKVVLFHKPFNVLTQFTDTDGRATLKDYIDLKGVYAAGRLDKDSEGLLVLTDDGKLQQKISHPRNKISKTYWAQVEGSPLDDELQALRDGVELKDGPTLPAQCKIIDEPLLLTPRNPPIRVRKHIPDTWLELTICEGRNRQVRRMCAAVGFPVLRLIRYRVGSWTLDGLAVGEYRVLDV